MFPKLRLMILAFLMVMVALGSAGSAHSASAAPARQQAGPQTWTVLVGSQSEMEQTDMGMMGAWQAMNFYPNKLTINEGDTVIWKINAPEIHDVVFPPPGQKFIPLLTPEGKDLVVNPIAILPSGGPNYDGTAAAGSGLLATAAPGVPEFKLTFTKAGSYGYFCAIHSNQLPDGSVVGMTANITVQAAGSALDKTPDQVSADAQAAIAADAQAASAADAQAKAVTAPTTNSDGTMTYHVNMGYDTGNLSYMRFSPTDLTVHVGDTVEWQQTSTVTPHTASLTSGQKEPDTFVVVTQTNGPPKFLLNGAVLAPSGGSSYAGTGFFSSGFLNGTQDPTPGPRSYKLTFTKAGTYEFICLLHDPMGMAGHITVLDATSAPGMPRTGSGFDLMIMALGLASALALALSGFVLRRRAVGNRA